MNTVGVGGLHLSRSRQHAEAAAPDRRGELGRLPLKTHGARGAPQPGPRPCGAPGMSLQISAPGPPAVHRTSDRRQGWWRVGLPRRGGEGEKGTHCRRGSAAGPGPRSDGRHPRHAFGLAETRVRQPGGDSKVHGARRPAPAACGSARQRAPQSRDAPVLPPLHAAGCRRPAGAKALCSRRGAGCWHARQAGSDGSRAPPSKSPSRAARWMSPVRRVWRAAGAGRQLRPGLPLRRSAVAGSCSRSSGKCARAPGACITRSVSRLRPFRRQQASFDPAQPGCRLPPPGGGSDLPVTQRGAAVHRAGRSPWRAGSGAAGGSDRPARQPPQPVRGW